MALLTYNDFRYGMVSEELRRRCDIQSYQYSARLLENVVPIRTGGVRLRPGTSLSFTPPEGAARIIPFVVSVDLGYILAIAPGRLYIYGLDISGKYVDISGGGFIAPWETADEICEIQYTQDYEKVVLVQRNHPPFVVQRSGTAFSAGSIVLETSTDAFVYSYDDSGKETKSPLAYDYTGLFTLNNYPSVVAFCGSRLWFGASTEHPYRLWASRPFDHFNFQTEYYYNRIDDSVTSEQYLDAIQGASETEEKLDDGNIWRVEKDVNPTMGTVTSTNAIYEPAADGALGDILGHREYDPETDTWGDPVYDGKSWTYAYSYTKPVYILDSTQRADSAMMLDMGLDRNETISWIAYGGAFLFVGTASTEWAIPSDANPQSYRIDRVDSCGSAMHIQPSYGSQSIFFVQSGGKRLRSIQSSSAGTAIGDLTYACSSILSAGVREMAWQRVPDPRLYAIMGDGSIAILCYDAAYQVSAWCVWTMQGIKAESIAVMDTPDGQDVYLLCSRGDEKGVLILTDSETSDWGGNDFIAHIETNFIDTLSTVLYTKRTYRVGVDSMKTRFKAGVPGTTLSSSYDFNYRMIMVYPWTTPSFEGLSVEIESLPGEPFILLTLVVETEVS